jgi:hypothetical protein
MVVGVGSGDLREGVDGWVDDGSCVVGEDAMYYNTGTSLLVQEPNLPITRSTKNLTFSTAVYLVTCSNLLQIIN